MRLHLYSVRPTIKNPGKVKNGPKKILILSQKPNFCLCGAYVRLEGPELQILYKLKLSIDIQNSI